MQINFFKYQATGNDFILIDDREMVFDIRNNSLIQRLCQRKFGIGADGLILLRKDASSDFRMIYFNADGYESSMCGNGGRAITAFANQLIPEKRFFTFYAIDGIHYSHIQSYTDHGCIVSLQMKDVDSVIQQDDAIILDTGSPHVVKFVADSHHLDVVNEGRRIRNSEAFLKEGINVNFVETGNEFLYVRTYERGVEDETLSCGTGVTASAISAYASGVTEEKELDVHTPGGRLQVKFDALEDGRFCNIFLSGPAEFVFEGKIHI
ncbi:MAG: diaminopimelate epimerase [Flavobacteriales bacterium]